MTTTTGEEEEESEQVVTPWDVSAGADGKIDEAEMENLTLLEQLLR